MKSYAAKVEYWLQVAFYQAILTQLPTEAQVPHVGITPAILYRKAVVQGEYLTEA
jgi:hypothetical protein